MITELLEKLISEKFEDIFKPTSRKERRKRIEHISLDVIKDNVQDYLEQAGNFERADLFLEILGKTAEEYFGEGHDDDLWAEVKEIKAIINNMTEEMLRDFYLDLLEGEVI